MLELLSKKEASNIVGCCRHRVERRLGGPCALIANGRAELKAWRAGRVMAYRAGEVMQAPEKPPVFYSAKEAARRLECCCVHQIKPLLGSPDCLYIVDGGKELPLWSHQSLNAAFALVQEARLSGSKAYDRQRAYRPRISRKARERAARLSARLKSIRQPKKRIIRFCSPRHTWADPKAVEACRVR